MGFFKRPHPRAPEGNPSWFSSGQQTSQAQAQQSGWAPTHNPRDARRLSELQELSVRMQNLQAEMQNLSESMRGRRTSMPTGPPLAGPPPVSAMHGGAVPNGAHDAAFGTSHPFQPHPNVLEATQAAQVAAGMPTPHGAQSATPKLQGPPAQSVDPAVNLEHVLAEGLQARSRSGTPVQSAQPGHFSGHSAGVAAGMQGPAFIQAALPPQQAASCTMPGHEAGWATGHPYVDAGGAPHAIFQGNHHMGSPMMPAPPVAAETQGTNMPPFAHVQTPSSMPPLPGGGAGYQFPDPFNLPNGPPRPGFGNGFTMQEMPSLMNHLHMGNGRFGGPAPFSMRGMAGPSMPVGPPF